MTTAPKNDDKKYNPDIGVNSDAPVQGSPVKWMLALLGLIIVLTAGTLWDREKISIKASPKIPELSTAGKLGRVLVNTQCAECHGEDGTGYSRKGPPLLHPMYREEVFPDHHFKRVIREGRRQRAWQFGPMPAQPQLSDEDINNILAFVREVHNETGVE